MKGPKRLKRLEHTPQLQYKNFRDRIHLEAHLRDNSARILLFILHFLLFVAVLYTYDDIVTIGRTHQYLGSVFKFEEADGISDVNGILAYFQTFVEAAYAMSSALTDANTMDSIDASRCFSAETTDVCRLKYWSIPMDDSDQYADNYFNTTNLFLDKLSSLNYHPSIQHCDYPGAPSNCIRAAPTDELAQRTYGLTPEDPIILDSRDDFMFSAVVPLAPIVWQTRGKREPCSGFGDTYNNQILGAGECTPDIECDPKKVTSFDNTQPNMQTGRKQTVYVSYIEPAFVCINRAVESSDPFLDKSWYPWSSYTDVTQGFAIDAADWSGSKVFWKFISDVSYLQTPFLGMSFVKDDPEAIQRCKAGDKDAMKCFGYGDPANCSDPMKAGADHLMWSETGFHTVYPCSLHEEWNKPFLDAKDPEQWKSYRKSSFITFETTTVAIAALVVSPRIEALPDMQSYVRLSFSFDASGYITVSKMCMTTSQTSDEWFDLVYVCVVFGGLYVINVLLNRKTMSTMMLTFDMLSSSAALGYVIMNLVLENSPPHIDEELERAFAINQQAAYFETFISIYSYNMTMATLRFWGFWIVLILFARLQVFLAVHPRLAVLVQTVRAAADDLFHFGIFLGIIICVFGFLGSWSFGTTMPQYGSFDRAMYQLFRMFTGDAMFDVEQVSFSYIVYLILFVCMVFITLLNFLLAIIVNAYTGIQSNVVSSVTEQDVVSDFFDAFRNFYLFFKNGWPEPSKIAEYLDSRSKYARGEVTEEEIEEEGLQQLAVTAEELLEGITFLDPKTEVEKKLFKSLKAVSQYVEYYGKKLTENYEYVLVENRPDLLQKTKSQQETEIERVMEEVAERMWTTKNVDGGSPEHILGAIQTRYLQKASETRANGLPSPK